jgi:hypothetical protein
VAWRHHRDRLAKNPVGLNRSAGGDAMGIESKQHGRRTQLMDAKRVERKNPD